MHLRCLVHNTTEDQSLLPSNKCIFPEVKLNFNAIYPVKVPCQASKVLICCWSSAGSGNAAHCAASPVPQIAELHTPLPHIPEILQVEYRGKLCTAWNVSRWRALSGSRVGGRRAVSGFRSSCRVLSPGSISNFLVCCWPPLLEMSKYYFSALSEYWEVTFCSLCFCRKNGDLTPMAWPSSGERQICMDVTREFLKPLQAAMSQKGERNKSSENHENTSRLIKCHVSPVEVWSLVFLAAKPNAMCVCVSFYTDRPGAASFLTVPQNFGIQAGICSS